MEYWLIPSSKLLWSITSSILNLWRHLLHANAVHDNILLLWGQGDTIITSSHSNLFLHAAILWWWRGTRNSATKSRLSITLWISIHFWQLLHFLVSCCVVYQRPSLWKGGSCWAGDIAIGGGGHGSKVCCANVGYDRLLCVVVCLAGTHKSTFDG